MQWVPFAVAIDFFPIRHGNRGKRWIWLRRCEPGLQHGKNYIAKESSDQTQVFSVKYVDCGALGPWSSPSSSPSNPAVHSSGKEELTRDCVIVVMSGVKCGKTGYIISQRSVWGVNHK